MILPITSKKNSPKTVNVAVSWLITTTPILKFAKTGVVMDKLLSPLPTPLTLKSSVMTTTLNPEMVAHLPAGSNLGTSALSKTLEEYQSVPKNSKSK